MEKNKLEIVSEKLEIVTQEEFEGKRVMYSYIHNKGQNPDIIGFAVYKDDKTETYMVKGTYSFHSGFTLKQSEKKIKDFGAIIEHIQEVCDELMPEEIVTEETQENEK